MIHEQNYLPGVTNRWLAPFVSRVIVAFPETVAMLGGRGEALGNPVRREFGLLRPRPEGSPVTSILVFGGSQGARVINRAICDALPVLSAMKGKLKMTHQTGEADLQTVTAAYRASGIDADVRPFISGMSKAFEDADLIVSRSGATTVAELTAAGRPAVLIPFAAAVHDHQTFNAKKLSDAGAAVLMHERELTGGALAGAILDLAGDRKHLARMAEESRALGKPEAAGRIAEVGADLIASGPRRVRS
jgi:UDP-N-acetylglucosamine--N-acetylmuramyl-(pentapeptide) pyrophosphoryl-undecaprenol N-acetylglucosamine transferase